MRNLIIILLLLLAACSSNPAQQSGSTSASSPEMTPTSVPPPEVDWQTFSDFSSLRHAYAHREDFAERCVKNKPTELLKNQYGEQHFKRAAEIARDFLNQCPVSAEFHIVYASTLFKLGQIKKANIHTQWFIGLTNSAMSEGDGKSPETAFSTMSTMEGRAVLARLQLLPLQKVLVQLSKNTRVEAITAKDKRGKVQTIYFDPEWEFIELKKAAQCQTNQLSIPLKSCDKYECIFVWSHSC